MSHLTKKLSKWDIELKKQETLDRRGRYRFVTVVLLAIAILFQVVTILAVLLIVPEFAHLMTGVMMLSLPATVGAIGAYLGISAYKKTD